MNENTLLLVLVCAVIGAVIGTLLARRTSRREQQRQIDELNELIRKSEEYRKRIDPFRISTP
jgi:uncharacterized membrane-anchored protein YhcB (DUF1043 family)